MRVVFRVFRKYFLPCVCHLCFIFDFQVADTEIYLAKGHFLKTVSALHITEGVKLFPTLAPGPATAIVFGDSCCSPKLLVHCVAASILPIARRPHEQKLHLAWSHGDVPGGCAHVLHGPGRQTVWSINIREC